ncbi:MAG: carboxypeptidase-like regulatory domain-containing protein, partial [Candidatus Acidiferrales bacterium]
MKSKLFLWMAIACLAVLCISPRVYGQATASFSGTVTDKSGSVIPGATVTATSQETGQTRTSTTDATGHYAINLLPIGNYTLRVESSGFQAAVQKDVRLQVDEQRELDFAMSPATVSSEVVVNATEVAVQTTNGSLGQ